MEMKIEKRQLLRNNEYYGIQEKLDNLYKDSKNNKKFKNLVSIIISEQNILLAYRNIKNNKGSMTKGTNNTTIEQIAEMSPKEAIDYVRNRISNYTPHSVRRVEIDKENGGKRPLGIPTIEDRLIQQCIKQIIEPICEAKFHKHSYGFRANRGTDNAIARAMFLMNKGFHYAVDVDIKGFFDNVNHGKLLKQLWNMGIEDKNLISIMSKLLKAEIEGEGIPEKGVPQGGIISTVLSNVVLNEFDWWISDQWETFTSKRKYSRCNMYRALKNTKLKEIFLVRYADDFKIFCKDYKTAQKVFVAVKKWLKKRLNLEISTEKSKVINLRKNFSNFLGLKLKVINKNYKQVAISHTNEKATKKIIVKIKERIKQIQKKPSIETVNKYNSTILGIHNYYRVATRVNLDFRKIAFLVSKSLYNRTKPIRGDTGVKSKAYEKYYGKYNGKVTYMAKIALFPIWGVTNKIPKCFSQEVCNYTIQGRSKIHKNIRCVNQNTLRYIMENPISGQSTEYNDNRISLYVGQYGLCAVTGEPLKIGEMEVHHKQPKTAGGSDSYKNLTFVSKNVHKLIHASKFETIEKYLEVLNLNKKGLEKLNKLRLKVGNCVI